MDTPKPRIWRARIWFKGGPFEGAGFIFKAPYGGPAEAAEALIELEERYELERFQLSPLPKRILSTFTREDREALERFGPAFDRVSTQVGIDWSL